MSFTVQVDVRGLEPWRRDATAAVVRAMKAAGSSALRAMRADASRRIREQKGIRAGQIDSALTMVYPTSKPEWTLVAKAKPIPLFAFGARQTGRGVSVEVTKGKRSVVRHAFLATMQSGHQGVFMRKGNPQIMQRGRYAGKKRQPIKEAFSASVSATVKGQAEEILKRGESVFRDTFNRMMRSGR